jgi:hypothetical protein
MDEDIEQELARMRTQLAVLEGLVAALVNANPDVRAEAINAIDMKRTAALAQGEDTSGFTLLDLLKMLRPDQKPR